jgi:hypothetical protein
VTRRIGEDKWSLLVAFVIELHGRLTAYRKRTESAALFQESQRSSHDA